MQTNSTPAAQPFGRLSLEIPLPGVSPGRDAQALAGFVAGIETLGAIDVEHRIRAGRAILSAAVPTAIVAKAQRAAQRFAAMLGQRPAPAAG